MSFSDQPMGWITVGLRWALLCLLAAVAAVLSVYGLAQPVPGNIIWLAIGGMVWTIVVIMALMDPFRGGSSVH